MSPKLNIILPEIPKLPEFNIQMRCEDNPKVAPYDVTTPLIDLLIMVLG